MFVGLLSTGSTERLDKLLAFNSKRSMKSVSASNQPRQARPTLFDIMCGILIHGTESVIKHA